MKNDKQWFEKVSIWVGIIAETCTILSFVISAISMFNNTKKKQHAITSDIRMEEDKNINITGDVNGDININEKILKIPTIKQMGTLIADL